MMQLVARDTEERNEKRPYLDLARALVADAMRHHDTLWLTSYMGTFCLDMIGYKPSIKVRIEEITANQKQSTKISHLWLWKGKKRTLGEIARMEEMPVRTIQNRMNLGWDLERAISTPLKSETARRYSWKGKRRTLKEIADTTGVSYAVLYNRIYLGWTIEDAVKTPIAPSKKGRTL